MVLERVHVLVGQCVSQSGNAFWNTMSTELTLSVDAIRKEIESCDCWHEFQLTRSLRGGTGLGSLPVLIMKIRENHADRITVIFSVYPSPKVSDIVEQYDDTLTIRQLSENGDETFVFDSDALYNISQNILKKPKYAKLNWVISLVMDGIAASLRSRFSGKLNRANLVLHFLLLLKHILLHVHILDIVKVTEQEITDQKWSSRNFLANEKQQDSNSAIQAVGDEIAKVEQKMSDDFVARIPNNIKSSITSAYINEWHICQLYHFKINLTNTYIRPQFDQSYIKEKSNNDRFKQKQQNYFSKCWICSFGRCATLTKIITITVLLTIIALLKNDVMRNRITHGYQCMTIILSYNYS